MSDDQRVQLLLDEALDTERTPEEVCKEFPELLPEVKKRWQRIRRMQNEVDAMFPTPTEIRPNASSHLAQSTVLPSIEGYEVEAILGRGGMGVVFRARHLRLNRIVALKMVLAGQFASQHERERFQREAEAIAELKHPNIVQIHDISESDGRPYFSMEYVEGGTLAQKLTGTPLPGHQAATMLLTLAEAVQAAHRCDIVHRDLKPANILLTVDGIPKISDFGLARRLNDEDGLTRTGTPLGTPSYMSPEQAGGKLLAVGPAVDIYALGAILYELLTGRPPFVAESTSETMQQVIAQDPVPPRSLNGNVPRDLETICLKCLHKEPHLRYATASALADDLGCFLRDEAISARPEGWHGRLVRRIRRRPLLSAWIVLGTLLILVLLTGGIWLLSDRAAAARAMHADQAATERAVEEDLKEMIALQRKAAWSEAKVSLERAKGRLGDRGSVDLRNRLNQSTRELELVERLNNIRLDGYTLEKDGLDFRKSDVEYEEAFRTAELFRAGEEDPSVVAARLANSPIRPVIIAALDHWASCCLDNPRRKMWLLKTVKLADSDSTGWRTLANDPAMWKDEARLAKLIDTAPNAYPSLPVLLLFVERMTANGKDPVPFLRRVQQAYPSDFWVNARLARELHKQNSPDAFRFYQAAIAIRPDTAQVHNDFGVALAAAGRREEAAVEYRLALKQRPTFAMARTNLALILLRLGLHDEAIEQVNLAFNHNVRTDGLYTILAFSLRAKGGQTEALEALRQAVNLNPKNLTAQSALRTVLIEQGKYEEARVAWDAALTADPPQHDAWYGYAELCLFLGHEDQYRYARQDLLAKFGASSDSYIAERTSRACLLLPSTGKELLQSVALAERAVTGGRSNYPEYVLPYFLFGQGLGAYRQGQYERVISTMQGPASKVLGPAPRLVLAMAFHQQGQVSIARKTMASAIAGHDWRPTNTKDQNGWIFHILRREAEQMIVPNLSAFLEGTYQPQDNDERIALLGVCQFTSRSLALVKLYAKVFETNPQLVEDVSSGLRFNAACAAALAGSGRGEDVAALNEQQRVQWRDQARQWMRADVASWIKELNRDPKAREPMRKALLRWNTEPDLSGVRDSAALDKLSTKERKDWLALWNEVRVALQAVGGK